MIEYKPSEEPQQAVKQAIPPQPAFDAVFLTKFDLQCNNIVFYHKHNNSELALDKLDKLFEFAMEKKYEMFNDTPRDSGRYNLITYFLEILTSEEQDVIFTSFFKVHIVCSFARIFLSLIPDNSIFDMSKEAENMCSLFFKIDDIEDTPNCEFAYQFMIQFYQSDIGWRELASSHVLPLFIRDKLNCPQYAYEFFMIIVKDPMYFASGPDFYTEIIFPFFLKHGGQMVKMIVCSTQDWLTFIDAFPGFLQDLLNHFCALESTIDNCSVIQVLTFYDSEGLFISQHAHTALLKIDTQIDQLDSSESIPEILMCLKCIGKALAMQLPKYISGEEDSYPYELLLELLSVLVRCLPLITDQCFDHQRYMIKMITFVFSLVGDELPLQEYLSMIHIIYESVLEYGDTPVISPRVINSLVLIHSSYVIRIGNMRENDLPLVDVCWDDHTLLGSNEAVDTQLSVYELCEEVATMDELIRAALLTSE